MQKNTLNQDFINRNKWLNFRASAIYPLDIKDRSDFLICFPNYWKIKNKIKNISCCIKLYNDKGQKIRSILYDINLHNEIYFSEVFKLNKFLGILEIDFQSTENLKFEFPGITGFYISPKKLISCVHSAGRFLLPNQKSTFNKTSEETNFSLKYKKNLITPFFSLFNSFIEKKENKIKLTLKNSENKIIDEKIILKELTLPYSNKIFYLDNYFNEEKLTTAEFCIVKTNASDVFPRMVCGNYHKKIHHYEVTHSYPVIKNKKDLIDTKSLKANKYNCYSYLHFVKLKDTKLNIKIFPTNLREKISSDLYLYDNKIKNLKHVKKIDFNCGSKLFQYKMQPTSNFGVIAIKQPRIPSRINATYIYQNNNKNKLSSDIAFAFKSLEYPIKKNHWGSVVLSNDIKSILLMSKFTHKKVNNTSYGYIYLYLKNKMIKGKKLKIKNNSFEIIDLNKLVRKKNKKISSISWIAKFHKNPEGVDFFSNTYSKKFICGEHGF